MPYTPTVWENRPSQATPINATNLNKIETGIKTVTDVTETGRLSDTTLDAKFAQLPKNGKNGLTGWYHVDGFGAKGDGTTDDSAAITAAVLAANGGRTYLPPGTYKAQLSLTSVAVDIFGPGEIIQTAGAIPISINQALGTAIPVTQGLTSFGPNDPQGSNLTQSFTTFTTPTNSYRNFKNGDVYHILSNDYYPFSMAAVGANNIWQAAFVPIHGIGVDVSSTTAGLVEGASFTGSTSGATAYVQSVVAMDSTNARIILSSLANADLVVGENLLVGGVSVGTVGAVYLVSGTKLEDTYTTAPMLRRVDTNLPVRLDVNIRAAGDPNSFVGTAARSAAIRVLGAYDVKISGRIYSAWGRAIQITSCYFGKVDVTVEGLPNHADLTEQAYGYGVELRGATELFDVKVFARNVRHAFTTNVVGGTYGNNNIAYGTVKRNNVHDSVGMNCYSQSFDTHEGAYFTVFDNCRASNPASANRFQSAAAGFVNRGFGTIFRNCLAENCVIGFSEGGVSLSSNFQYINRYENCVARDFGQWGYSQDSDAVGSNSRVEIAYCDMRGDGTGVTQPYYQAGYRFRGGITEIEYSRCSRSNGAPWQAIGPARLTINNFTADYRDANANVAGGRVDGTLTELNIFDYNIIPTAGGGTPLQIFRNNAGDTVWNIDGVHGVSNTLPPLYSSNAGSPTFNIRNRLVAVRPVTILGDVAATLTPRGSQPTQIWNSPLTANRAVTLSTSSVVNGDTFHIVRTATATGAFDLTVLGRAIAAGQWVDVVYTGTAWIISGSGAA